MEPRLAVVALFAIAAAVAIGARRARVPYTVALVVAGLVLNSLGAFEPPHLTKRLLYTLFLPGLVFEAAFALDLDRLRQSKWLALGLAFPGVAVSIAVTAGVLVLGRRMMPADGAAISTGAVLAFAALISATDPIAVVALFRQLGAPRRLAVLVESESLLNDGTATIAFALVVDGLTRGAPGLGGALGHVVVVIGAALVLGGAIGGAASLVMRWIDDPMIETTLTTVAAYGSFVLAEDLEFSGILATVAAGVVCGRWGAPRSMSASTRLAAAAFWEYLAFALNSLVFLLIGFEVRLRDVFAHAGLTLGAYAAVLLGRAVTVVVGAALASRSRERIEWSWTAILGWGGLRGALSMVLALGLPDTLPERALIIDVTFGVVTLSILLQGTSMRWLLKSFGLVREDAFRHEAAMARVRTAHAAKATLSAMRAEGLRAEIADALAEECAKREAEAADEIARSPGTAEELRRAERRAAERRLVHSERAALDQALRSGAIGDEAYHKVKEALDARLLELRQSDEA